MHTKIRKKLNRRQLAELRDQSFKKNIVKPEMIALDEKAHSFISDILPELAEPQIVSQAH